MTYVSGSRSRLILFGKQKCAGISKPFFYFDSPVTEEEIRAAALPFVRKIDGFNKPLKTNEGSLLDAIEKQPELRVGF